MKIHPNYNRNVFINCPFDSEYDPIFNAILFAVHRCGFVLRCSKEFGDSSKIRIKNIVQLIRESRFAIHDLSRVAIDQANQLPRFNMPLELGIFMGAIEFGGKQHQEKSYLILESQKHRFKMFVSDLSGQDIQHHGDDPKAAIKGVRNWLQQKTTEVIPSASVIHSEYVLFCNSLPALCLVNMWTPEELTFLDYSSLVTNWLAV